MTTRELPPSEARSKSRRAGATIVFVAAAFGAMAMLSVPLARLLPSPVRPFFTFAAPIEGLLHPSRASTSGSGPGHEAGGGAPSVRGPSGLTIRAGQPASAPIPSGPGSPASQPPAPFPSDRIGSGPGIRANGGRTMSTRDLQTLSALNLLVDRFGFRVLMPLRNTTDVLSSAPDALALIVRNGISALPPGVTPPLVHALLADLRQDLPKLVRDHLRRPASPSPPRTDPRHRPENPSGKRVPPKRRHHEGTAKSKPKHRRPR